MSAIYFHTLSHDPVRISGSERAYMNLTINNLFFAMVNELWDLKKLVPKDCYVQGSYSSKRETYEKFKLWAGTGYAHNFEMHHKSDSGQPSVVKKDVWATILNTAYKIGSDQIKLMTRIHAQCEVHGYIEPQNREWLAEIIQKGSDQGVFRDGANWGGLVKLLREKDGSPVVMSYSVTESFPSTIHSDSKSKTFDEYADWEVLSHEKQWDKAMSDLRRVNKEAWLEITPDRWGNYHFVEDFDVFGLEKALQRQIYPLL